MANVKKLIKLTNAQVVSLVQPSVENGNMLIFSKEYPASIALRLGILYEKLSSYYYSELDPKISALYQKYGTKQADTDKIVVPNINLKSFNTDIDKLMEETYEVEFDPLLFVEIKDLKFSPAEIVALLSSGLMN